MNRSRVLAVLALVSFPLYLSAQSGNIVIPAGTPEDQALQAISKEEDAQKKLTMYEDFVQKFSSNPAAQAYGNWQIAQSYQVSGDLPKALEYGDKALAAAPGNLDILVMQTNIASHMKDNSKVIEYATKGGAAYNDIGKEKPAGVSDADFANQVQEQKQASKNTYEFLEAAAYNAIGAETDPQKRMADIEAFTPAFPHSQYDDAIASYAMLALSQLNDKTRLVAYGEKTLAANPESLPTLLLLANTYADESSAASLSKAAAYAEKAIAVAKPDAPDATDSRKVSAGVAHSTLGYVYMKQDKTVASVGQLKTAVALLKPQPEQEAVALYRLGYAYAKLGRTTEARSVLEQAVAIPGPVQQPARDLLSKVNQARARGH